MRLGCPLPGPARNPTGALARELLRPASCRWHASGIGILSNGYRLMMMRVAMHDQWFAGNCFHWNLKGFLSHAILNPRRGPGPGYTEAAWAPGPEDPGPDDDFDDGKITISDSSS
jgi:hypothetical protein